MRDLRSGLADTVAKSKVAAPRIFRENKKRETITNSHTLNRVVVVASEFDARGSGPSRLYTKDAPTARRIFDHLCERPLQQYRPLCDMWPLRFLQRKLLTEPHSKGRKSLPVPSERNLTPFHIEGRTRQILLEQIE